MSAGFDACERRLCRASDSNRKPANPFKLAGPVKTPNRPLVARLV